MLRPRWRKLLRDATALRGRTAMMVAGIAISLFGVGTALTAYSILARELRRSYLDTRPASATLLLDGADGRLADQAARRPGIAAAEARATLVARVQVGAGRWKPLLLFVIDDFDRLRVGTFRRERGAWPPPAATLLVERAALPVLHTDIGAPLLVRLPDGRQRTLAVSGVVHDPGLAPAWQEGGGYGYITAATRIWLDGRTPPLDELRVVVADGSADTAGITATAEELASWLGRGGHPVRRIEVPPPGRHPHQGQMVALLSILMGFSLMGLVLSGLLVATMMAALLAREIRQIGVMKAVGATTGQLARLYVVLVAALGAAAFVLGVAPALAAGRAYAAKAAAMLNFDLATTAVPWWVFAVQAAAGIGVPLALAAVPIARGCRITVREALADHGVRRERFAPSRLDAWLGRRGGSGPLAAWNRTLLLALRNSYRRRARTLLTLSLLAAAGALFITSWNVREAWKRTLTDGFGARRYDLDVRLARTVPAAPILDAVRAVPGVAAAEAWGLAPASFGKPGRFDVAHVYPDGGHGSLSIVAPPAATRMVRFPLLAGRWLRAGDTAAVVLNPSARLAAPAGVQVGDWLDLGIGAGPGTPRAAGRYRVVGLVREVGAAGAVYMTDAALAGATGRPGTARTLRLVLRDHDPASRQAVAAAVESALAGAGAAPYSVTPVPAYSAALGDHILILIQALAWVAGLMGVVGALGLAAAMSVNVLERTRELGILQAIGATPRVILWIVVGEGVAIGLASWVAALAGALPLTMWIDSAMGRIFFAVPLTPAAAPAAMAGWLALVAVTAAAASFLPAWRASRLVIATALQYD
jgi:putative ABC transport system permease protein